MVDQLTHGSAASNKPNNLSVSEFDDQLSSPADSDRLNDQKDESGSHSYFDFEQGGNMLLGASRDKSRARFSGLKTQD